MGLLTSSGSSITPAPAGKAVMGGSRTVDLPRRWALLVAVAEFGAPAGSKGFVVSERGERGRKSVHGDGVNRVAGLTPIFRCGMFDALFLP